MSTDTIAHRNWTSRTRAAQALGRIDEATRAVVPPVHLTTTFIRDPDNQYRTGNIYGRPDNETVREAEAVIATLEERRPRWFSAPACRQRLHCSLRSRRATMSWLRKSCTGPSATG